MSQSKLSILNPAGNFTFNLLDAMDDFTDIKTIVMMSRCSKKVNLIVAPLLKKKIQNADAMRQAVLLTFPSIIDLPDVDPVHGADYFNGLLTQYFTAQARPKLHINHSVGNMLFLISIEVDGMCGYLKDEMHSSLGRRRVLECINEWRQQPDTSSIHPLTKLQLLENLIHDDFAVPNDRIDSRFGPARRAASSDDDSGDESLSDDSGDESLYDDL